VFDRDPGVVGRQAGGIDVQPYSDLKGAVRDKNIIVGVLAVPATAAQDVADDLVDAGVRIIFNYSEGLLDVPGDVQVHTSNPAVELLHALYFHLAATWGKPCFPHEPPSSRRAVSGTARPLGGQSPPSATHRHVVHGTSGHGTTLYDQRSRQCGRSRGNR
jgi:CoA binding protein